MKSDDQFLINAEITNSILKTWTNFKNIGIVQKFTETPQDGVQVLYWFWLFLKKKKKQMFNFRISQNVVISCYSLMFNTRGDFHHGINLTFIIDWAIEMVIIHGYKLQISVLTLIENADVLAKDKMFRI